MRTLFLLFTCSLLLLPALTLQAAWYDDNYLYKRSIVIQSGQVDGTFVGFPVLITEADLDANFFNHVQGSTPADIDVLFTNAAEDTPLNSEIVVFNGPGQQLEAWVQTQVNASTNVTIWVYYGSTTATHPTDTATWSNGYSGVWHMQQAPSASLNDILESTIYANHGSSQNMEAGDSLAGQIGQALNFDGNNEYLNCGNDSSLGITGVVTVSAWVNFTDPNENAYMRILSKKPAWNGTEGYGFECHPNNGYLTVLGSGGDYARGDSVSWTTNWHYVVGVINGGTGTLYVDGANETTDSGVNTVSAGAQDFTIARLSGAADYFRGQIDEVRVSIVNRPTGWITTTYNNQSNPGNFYNVNPELTHPERYRSVGPGNTTALDTGGGNNLDLAGTTAGFASAVSGLIGVGDVIFYDADNNGTRESLAFIHNRTDAQTFTVRSSDGGVPTPTSTADQDWRIYRSYTSLANAESGTENSIIGIDFDTGNRDAITEDEVWHFACYNDAVDTTAVDWDGWTLGVANYVRIFTPNSVAEAGSRQRHSGVWSTSAYRIEVANNYALRIRDDHLRVEGLQVRVTSVSGPEQKGIFVRELGAGGTAWISHCIIRGITTATFDWHVGISLEASSASTVYAWNNIIYDFRDDSNSVGIELNDADGTVFSHNNTIVNCYNGLWNRSGIFTSRNTATQGCTNGFNGIFAPSSDHNLSDLAADAPGANSINSADVSFVNEIGPPMDYHLADGDNQAKNAGMDLSTSFTVDIDDDTRTVPWCMGADENDALAGTPTFTPTATESATVTVTPSITQTATSSPTSTESPPYTPTFTPTVTSTPTITPTLTISATLTISPTATISATRTPSASITVTRTITLTPTVTPTITNTPVIVVPSGLEDALVYPNPYQAKFKSLREVTFHNIPRRALIRIYDISGKFVRKLEKNSDLPYIRWNLQNSRGSNVSSGVFIYIIQANGQEKRGKLALLQ